MRGYTAYWILPSASTALGELFLYIFILDIVDGIGVEAPGSLKIFPGVMLQSV